MRVLVGWLTIMMADDPVGTICMMAVNGSHDDPVGAICQLANCEAHLTPCEAFSKGA